MKIIGTDNFNREWISDFLVCENVVNEYFGNKIVDYLNKDNGENGPRYFRLVDDDYVLYKWEP